MKPSDPSTPPRDTAETDADVVALEEVYRFAMSAPGRLRDGLVDALNRVYALAEELPRLRSQLAEARKDTERLEKFAAMMLTELSWSTRKGVGHVAYLHGIAHSSAYRGTAADALRFSIDTAASPEQREPR